MQVITEDLLLEFLCRLATIRTGNSAQEGIDFYFARVQMLLKELE